MTGKTRGILRAGLLGLALASAPEARAQAQVSQAFIERLRAEGYESISIGRTLLGRIRIVARDATRQREIVVNPATGELLRDYVRREDRGRDDDRDDNGSGPSESGGSGGSGGGAGDDGDDGSDDGAGGDDASDDGSDD